MQIASGDRPGQSDPRPLPCAGRFCLFLALFLVSLLPGGCADSHFLARNCPTPPNPQTAAEIPIPYPGYLIGCPDILEITFLDFPEWDVMASVALDGCLPLEHPGSPRVEGRTLEDVRYELARMAGVSAERVGVRLIAPRSSQLYIHGPIRGRTRIVPYQGPEPVIDMLRRIGGLPPGSKLSQVFVVRPNVALGLPPEVFRVDVARVLLDHNQATNLALRPSDEIYIGETRESTFSRLLPDWMAPIYRRVVGLMPDDWWQRTRPGPQWP